MSKKTKSPMTDLSQSGLTHQQIKLLRENYTEEEIAQMKRKDEVYCFKENCEPYRLRGANAVMSMVETLDGKVINILEIKNVMRVFERVGQ